MCGHSIIFTLIACLGAFSFGTAMAWTSPALPFIADCQLGDACDFNYRYEQCDQIETSLLLTFGNGWPGMTAAFLYLTSKIIVSGLRPKF